MNTVRQKAPAKQNLLPAKLARRCIAILMINNAAMVKHFLSVGKTIYERLRQTFTTNDDAAS